MISPVTLETSFLNSTFKIWRLTFDIILIFVASCYMIRIIITRLILNVQFRLKNKEVGIRGIVESRITTNKVSFLASDKPGDARNQFSQFDIQNLAFDIRYYFNFCSVLLHDTYYYYSINIECPIPIEE